MDQKNGEQRSLLLELSKISHLMKRGWINTPGRPADGTITSMNGWFIGYLLARRDSDVFQRDIEEHFSVRRSTVSNIVQLMEKKGLITREPVHYDARLKKLVLTEKALEAHNRVYTGMLALEKRIISGVTEQELDTVYAVIEKIKANIESMIDD